MLSKCANPACSAKFLRLHDGRLFVKQLEGDCDSAARPERQREYFWLCNSCCRTLTIVVEKGKPIQVIPLHEKVDAARAAS